jgi:hypothetical protein
MYCDALGAGSWQKLADVSAPPVAQTLSVTDSAGVGQSQRFYRLVTPQMP